MTDSHRMDTKHRKKENVGDDPKKKKKAAAAQYRRGKHDDDDDVDDRGNIRGLIAYSEEEDEEEMEMSDTSTETSTEEDVPPPHRERPPVRKAAQEANKRIHREILAEAEPIHVPARHRKKLRKTEEDTDMKEDAPHKKSYEESEEESEDEEEEDEESEEEEDDEEEMENNDVLKPVQSGGFRIQFGIDDDSEGRMVPKRHTMKKESAIVKKFVELVTKPFEENSIDDLIDRFKGLTEPKQAEMIVSLERRSNPATQEPPLMFKILSMNLSPEIQTSVLNKYSSLQSADPSSGEYFKLRAWLEKLTSVPLGLYKSMPVRIEDGTDRCAVFMEQARTHMTNAIFGQDDAKIQILQFIASKITNPSANGLSLLLIGPPGVGKTSLIMNGIGKALEWPFQMISLGGDSDASTFVGHQLVYESSHCGKIVNSLVSAKTMSMILMFDEIDKVSDTPKGEEIQNVLVHLTDPVQNASFEDKYLTGVPIDLSKVMFVFSGNDLTKINKILLDRMIIVKLDGYSLKDKQSIAEKYLLPTALREVGLTEKVAIGPEIITHIIREYASAEQGVRELKRCIEAVTQKINMLRIFNSKDLPFYIKDFSLPFVLKKEHVDLFLKKKDAPLDPSVSRMYV